MPIRLGKVGVLLNKTDHRRAPQKGRITPIVGHQIEREQTIEIARRFPE